MSTPVCDRMTNMFDSSGNRIGIKADGSAFFVFDQHSKLARVIANTDDMICGQFQSIDRFPELMVLSSKNLQQPIKQLDEQPIKQLDEQPDERSMKQLYNDLIQSNLQNSEDDHDYEDYNDNDLWDIENKSEPIITSDEDEQKLGKITGSVYGTFGNIDSILEPLQIDDDDTKSNDSNETIVKDDNLPTGSEMDMKHEDGDGDDIDNDPELQRLRDVSADTDKKVELLGKLIADMQAKKEKEKDDENKMEVGSSTSTDMDIDDLNVYPDMPQLESFDQPVVYDAKMDEFDDASDAASEDTLVIDMPSWKHGLSGSNNKKQSELVAKILETHNIRTWGGDPNNVDIPVEQAPLTIDQNGFVEISKWLFANNDNPYNKRTAQHDAVAAVRYLYTIAHAVYGNQIRKPKHYRDKIKNMNVQQELESGNPTTMNDILRPIQDASGIGFMAKRRW